MCAHIHVCYVTTLSVLQVVVATEAEEQIISPPYTMTVFEILFSYYYSNFFLEIIITTLLITGLWNTGRT